MSTQKREFKKSSLHRVKDRRRYYKGREGKTDEIKRALGHRARLRREYFKVLRKEGEHVPNKSIANGTSKQYKRSKNLDFDDKKLVIKKPFSYQERMNIARKRKEDKRKLRLQKTKEKIQSIHKKETERARKHKMITKGRTKRGQPLMAPRINMLLEKIKKEVGTSNLQN